jgi:hypothetical protein
MHCRVNTAVRNFNFAVSSRPQILRFHRCPGREGNLDSCREGWRTVGRFGGPSCARTDAAIRGSLQASATEAANVENYVLQPTNDGHGGSINSADRSIMAELPWLRFRRELVTLQSSWQICYDDWRVGEWQDL